MATTYNNLYLDTRSRLKEHGIEGAQLEAREIVCYASDKTKEQFFRDASLYAMGQVEQRVEELVQRRLAGEPVAYLVGEWEFYGITLDITTDVLIPRVDTEILAERAIALTNEAGVGARVLDLCAGSGCIGLAVACHAPECRVLLADISDGALQVCKRNVRRCEVNNRVACMKVDALQPPAPALWDFDVITCNPPYITTADMETLDVSVKDYEPHLALAGGVDGLDYYRAIAQKWGAALRLGGRILFEVGMGQAGDVEMILAEYGYEDIKTHQDTGGIWRVVEGTLNG